MEEKHKEWEFVPEPTSEWTQVGNESKNLWKMYHDNRHRWALTFQLFALSTKLEYHQVKSNYNVTISERSPEADL